MHLTEKQVQIIKEYFSDKPVKNIYVFGSYARGEAIEGSDIDLMIELDENKTRLSIFDFVRLQTGIEASLNIKVDLIESHLMFPRIKTNVEKEKLLLYKK